MSNTFTPKTAQSTLATVATMLALTGIVAGCSGGNSADSKTVNGVVYASGPLQRRRMLWGHIRQPTG